MYINTQFIYIHVIRSDVPFQKFENFELATRHWSQFAIGFHHDQVLEVISVPLSHWINYSQTVFVADQWYLCEVQPPPGLSESHYLYNCLKTIPSG